MTFSIFAIIINDQIFLIPLQHWEGTGIRTLEGVTMSTMANVDKNGVPKVTGMYVGRVPWYWGGGGRAECIEF